MNYQKPFKRLNASQRRKMLISELDEFRQIQLQELREKVGTHNYLKFMLTDLEDAHLFAKLFWKEVCYCKELGSWFIWNGNNWEKDLTGRIQDFLDELVEVYLESAFVNFIKNKETFNAYMKHATSLKYKKKIDPVLNLAKQERLIACKSEKFDKDPLMMSVKGAYLYLQSGDSRSPSATEYITKTSNVEYDREAEEPKLWLQFLNQIFCGNDELINFVQRAIGYTLTGDTKEQVFFFLYGVGANGKTTFLEVMAELFGDYHCTLQSNSLMSKTNNPELHFARLVGKRLVISSEVAQGSRFNEASLKQITGGDVISARTMYHNPFEYKPQFKLWIMGNHKPTISDTTESIWRRVILIPFEAMFTKENRDPDLAKKLKKEMPGILNWALDGCKEWISGGLQIPNCLNNARNEYKCEMDFLGEFIGDCCISTLEHTNDEKVQLSNLYKVFQRWREENSEQFYLSKRRLGSLFDERGFSKRKSTGGQVYVYGLQIKDKYQQ